jgi:hypothetical protein
MNQESLGTAGLVDSISKYWTEERTSNTTIVLLLYIDYWERKKNGLSPSKNFLKYAPIHSVHEHVCASWYVSVARLLYI